MKAQNISVVVPVYNIAKYLPKCIESIIKQTYNAIEILLINDGSTDESGKICDEYAQKDDRIKVIHQNNQGISATRNVGIKASTCDYIVFIDSDDYINEDYIETLYNCIKKTNSDVASVNYNVVNSDGTISFDGSKEVNLKENEIVTLEGTDIIKEYLSQKIIKNFVWNKIYKKDIICEFKVGITYEDIAFTLEVLSKAKKVTFINKSCYNYVRRDNSLTATISEKNLYDFGKAIEDRYKVVKKNFKDLESYNIYAFLESALALSTKYVITERKYKTVEKKVFKFINILLNYIKDNEEEFFKLLNDYQKSCICLMKYNTELFFNFLGERQKLRLSGVLK